MKQILQDLKSGATRVANVPAPQVKRGEVLIRTSRSLISPGTERMLVNFGRSGLLGKARSQPDKVRQVLDKCRTDGIAATLEAVNRKLDEPLPLGYCNVGTVIDVGQDVTDLAPGDRVASNGPHAEVVAVPRNLCARVPDDVTDEQAAFTVLGAIGLQGIRLAKPTFGEKVVVYGLGLIGQVCVQLLRSAGCEVLGVDINGDRLALAHSHGAQVVNVGCEDPVAAAEAFTDGVGADAVLITASAKGDEIVRNAAEMSRQRGRIVLVGVVGLNLSRDDFYKKELTFQVSCSYGPGRYDPQYEQKGQDYPIGHVRWTEQRNFQAVLSALSAGRLRVADLVSHRYPIAGAQQAYDLLGRGGHALAVMLEYPASAPIERTVNLRTTCKASPDRCRVGLIGAGSFARAQLLPALRAAGADLRWIASAGGVSAQHAARKFDAAAATTDTEEVLADPDVDAVIIATRHNLHAELVCRALAEGKHVFVEKPLAMDEAQLEQIRLAASQRPDLQLAVGFNRRFSPHTRKLAHMLAGRTQPLRMAMTVNAGPLPGDHWQLDPRSGGGRIIGEGCHFIDLLAHLADADVTTVSALGDQAGGMSILLGLADGSTGTIQYVTSGSTRYPKETLEVHSRQRTWRLENFRRLKGWGVRGFARFKTFRQDKGHLDEIAAFCEAVSSGGPALMSLERLMNVTRATFAACESAAQNRLVDLTGQTAIQSSQVIQSASWKLPASRKASAPAVGQKLAS